MGSVAFVSLRILSSEQPVPKALLKCTICYKARSGRSSHSRPVDGAPSPLSSPGRRRHRDWALRAKVKTSAARTGKIQILNLAFYAF